MKNLNDLNELLFAQMERVTNSDLKDEALMDEIRRSDAVVKISGQIVNSANTALSALRFKSGAMDANLTLPSMLQGDNDVKKIAK